MPRGCHGPVITSKVQRVSQNSLDSHSAVGLETVEMLTTFPALSSFVRR